VAHPVFQYAVADSNLLHAVPKASIVGIEIAPLAIKSALKALETTLSTNQTTFPASKRSKVAHSVTT
jgi:ABC-type uncharacterized transport system involved in gliding motility auxiliary subunit